MNDEHKETARELGLPEDDPAVMRDLQMLASSGAGQAPQWGLRAGQPRPVGKVNRLAVFALFCSFILPVLGIVFGTLALNEIEDGGGKERGVGNSRPFLE